MRPKKKCAVRGCDDQDPIEHRFPSPSKDFVRFKKWVEASGNDTILNLNPEFVYRTKMICDRHFEAECRSTNRRLIKSAIPTLFCTPIAVNISGKWVVYL